jgi:epoxyqueuosine reductase
MRETENSGRRSADSPESLVKRAALDLGFSAVGIAAPEASARSNAVFESWIGDGKHGEMRYLSAGSDKRKSPSILLEGARSVVCVGVNYYSSAKERWNRDAARDGRAEVALYALGRDYHGVLEEMLAALGRGVERLFPGARTRPAVDTEPISERDFAIRAGIAWPGKNACVISPEYGSWIFLGELFTDLELRPDRPLESLCGSCARCVDACPTGALGGFVLDARRCISYLTIEKRGEIPAEFHRPIGRNLFGCDVCQRVCPFNRASRESVVFPGGERNGLARMKVDDLRVISDDEFRMLARDTAIRRCKPEGMRRNAEIVSKNDPSGGGDGSPQP